MANIYNSKLTSTALPNNYSITGANGYTTGAMSWTSPTATFNNSNNQPIMTIPNGEDKVILSDTATLDVKGKVMINGLDLEERLKTIEKVLMIPERDAIMEAKYPSLKKKFDEYITALEKYRTFDRLKGE
jgi:hypothetical protein